MTTPAPQIAPGPGSTPPEPVATPAPKVLRLAPTKGWVSLGLRDVWAYRELLWFLAMRDLKVRYKQTVLGASWAVLQPVATAVVFTVVFGRLAKISSNGQPYAVFALCGLVVWTFFSSSVSTTSLSLVTNTNLISKVYFPRLCIPIASLVAGFVDLLVATGVLFVAMAIYGVGGGWRMFAAIPIAVLAFAAALGVSLWLAAIAARYRDVRHIVPFLMQFWLFATPVAYPSSLLAEKWHVLYALNPMVGVVEGFRWSMLGSDTPVAGLVATSTVVTVLVLVSGALYFRRVERTLADVI